MTEIVLAERYNAAGRYVGRLCVDTEDLLALDDALPLGLYADIVGPDVAGYRRFREPIVDYLSAVNRGGA